MDIKRILLVSYDCVRADVAYLPDMAGVTALAAAGVRFTFAVSSAPLTPVSHATVFTGLQPGGHKLRHLFRERLDPKVDTLAAALRRAGFLTAGIVSCPGLNRWYGFDRGFDHYDDWLPPLPSGEDALSLKDVKYRGLALKRADLVVERAKEWLGRRGHDDRWFLFVHFFDAHWPYDPPTAYGAPQNPYEGEVRYTDRHFQQLLGWLEARGWLADTLIVLFGDHGEDLAGWYPNDKSGNTGPHPEEEGHGCLLFQQTQHVPLIVSHPGFTPHDVDDPVGLVDVFPTIAALTGLAPLRSTHGVDLSPALKGTAAVSRPPLYAETLYPRELVENTGTFPAIENLQAFWLDRTRKIIMPYGCPDRALAYDLTADPLEQRPTPLAQTAWGTPEAVRHMLQSAHVPESGVPLAR